MKERQLYFLKTKQTTYAKKITNDIIARIIVKLLLIIIFTNLLNIKQSTKQSLCAQIKALLFDFCQAQLINFHINVNFHNNVVINS